MKTEGDPPADFAPPPVSEIAARFPQFEILGFLGCGGMGAVYQARQPSLDRLIALKILQPAVAGDPGFAERFNREARALARLNHPNIVAIYDFGIAGDLSFLAMEFVDGANLREIGRSTRLTPEQALRIVPQICDALQFAHNEGVVHRDIKPENILLDRKGRVKITDFGIAKIVGGTPEKFGLTGAKDIIGTPHYMAPEQLEQPGAVDHRADIFSLGVVFYELLTGELPIGRFSPPSQKVPVDVRLDDVVLRTLEKEPERRYQQADEVKTDVQAITDTPPPLAAPNAPPLIHPNLSTQRQGGARVWIGAAATAAVMAGLILIGLVATVVFFRPASRSERPETLSSPSTQVEPPVSPAQLAGAQTQSRLSQTQIPESSALDSPAQTPGTPTGSSRSQAALPTSSAATVSQNQGTFPELRGARVFSGKPLRYIWKVGSPLVYSIKVETTADDYIESASGSVSYTVRSVDGDRAVLSYTSYLGAPYRRPKPGKQMPMSFAHGLGNFWRSSSFGMSPREMQVDSTGRILSQSGNSNPLPQALGAVERLIFEPLPATAQSQWEVTDNCVITQTRMAPLSPMSHFAREAEVTLAAREKATYRIVSSSGAAVQIKKQYELKTDETAGGEPRVKLTGEATVTFDAALGLPRSMDFQGTLVETGESATYRTPLRLSYNRMQNLTNPPSGKLPGTSENSVELTAMERRELLMDLRSSSVASRSLALSRLANAKTSEPRSEVVLAILSTVNDSNWGTRQSAARALGVWGTAEAVPALIKLLDDSEFSVRWAAMDALAELKSDRAAVPLALRLADATDSMQAAKALQALGPAAEVPVIQQLTTGNDETRQAACRVLREIGTIKSVGPLTAAASNNDGITAMLAKEAIRNIEARSRNR